ncbi:MAG: preprotein translocase subunit YajC [Planctomycetes bacterium]|nr:preprotein translocase subunit YajC [Planctomycetota bacterium]
MTTPRLSILVPSPTTPFAWQNKPEAEVTKPMGAGGAPTPTNATQGAPDSPAGTAPSGPLGLLSMLWPILLIFGLMWLLVIRPERKRQKELEKVRSELKKGDRVLLNAGMVGVIAQVTDDWIVVEIADKVRVQFQKGAVAQVLEVKDKEKAEATAK